jgi:hypothetical protein
MLSWKATAEEPGCLQFAHWRLPIGLVTSLVAWLQKSIPLTSAAGPSTAFHLCCLLQHPSGYEASLDPWLQQLWAVLRERCPLPPGVQQV